MNITFKELLERQEEEREAFVSECKHEILCIDEELFGDGTEYLRGMVRCAKCQNTFSVDYISVNELCHWLVEKQKEYTAAREKGDDMIKAVREKLDKFEG